MSFLIDEISRHPLFECRMFPVLGKGKRKNIYITLGLPGVGKSTFCELMRASCPPGTAKVIIRDAVRVGLIWETRKLTTDQQKEINEDIDFLVTQAVCSRVADVLKNEPSISVIIIDGCYTLYDDLKYTLEHIEGDCAMLGIEYALHLCMIGSPLSMCVHNVSDKKKNDYTDYRTGGYHTSVPKEVLDMKRTQYFNLLCRETFQHITELCDYVYVLPAYDPRAAKGQ